MGSEFLKDSSPEQVSDFFARQFPYYLSIGMSSSQFWDEDCQLAKNYRKASEIRSRQKNEELWLQGAYIYHALCCASPLLHAFAKAGTTAEPYPDKPYPLSKRENIQRREEEERKNRKAAMAAFTAWSNSLTLDDEQA